MLTYTESRAVNNDKMFVKGVCTSSDTKPTTGISNGSQLIEMNTSKTYMYNEEDGEWEEVSQSSGGGGGGSGDFSIAKVTVVNNTPAAIQMPCVYDEGEAGTGSPAMIYGVNIALSSGEYKVPLYKGNLFVDLVSETVVDGDIAVVNGSLHLITGDCTIRFEGTE